MSDPANLPQEAPGRTEAGDGILPPGGDPNNLGRGADSTAQSPFPSADEHTHDEAEDTAPGAPTTGDPGVPGSGNPTFDEVAPGEQQVDQEPNLSDEQKTADQAPDGTGATEAPPLAPEHVEALSTAGATPDEIGVIQDVKDIRNRVLAAIEAGEEAVKAELEKLRADLPHL